MYTKPIELKVQKDSGYLYFNDKDHPLAIGNSGKVYYHRHVASMARGRWLTSEEHVHHVDGNKKNNEPENLLVVSGAEHVHLHKGYLKSKTCAACGTVFYAPRKRGSRYFCSPKCVGLGQRRADRPSEKELATLMATLNWCALGRKFGVTDNAVRKWARAYGLL